jgi:hypothetical protein
MVNQPPQAAMLKAAHGAAGGIGPDSNGPSSRQAGSRIFSDPQSPQQLRDELETVSRLLQ